MIGAAAVTVSVAPLLVTPSKVAVMVAIPSATPVARPNESTVATEMFVLSH